MPSVSQSPSAAVRAATVLLLSGSHSGNPHNVAHAAIDEGNAVLDAFGDDVTGFDASWKRGTDPCEDSGWSCGYWSGECAWVGISCTYGAVKRIQIEGKPLVGGSSFDPSKFPDSMTSGFKLYDMPGFSPALDLTQFPRLYSIYFVNVNLRGQLDNWDKWEHDTNSLVIERAPGLKTKMPTTGRVKYSTYGTLQISHCRGITGKYPRFSEDGFATTLILRNTGMSGSAEFLEPEKQFRKSWTTRIEHSTVSNARQYLENLPNSGASVLGFTDTGITGAFPWDAIVGAGQSRLGYLRELHLGSNSLTGDIPTHSDTPSSTWLWFTTHGLKSLEKIDLSHNKLDSAEPPEMHWPSVTYMDYSYNQLKFGDAANILWGDRNDSSAGYAALDEEWTILFNDCGITGELDLKTFDSKYLNLSKLHLADNSITKVHLDSEEFPSRLNLKNNKLSGTFLWNWLKPNTDKYAIKELDLGSNSLEGTVAWSEFVRLGRVDLSHNKFSGTVKWADFVPSGQAYWGKHPVLALNNNEFDGTIEWTALSDSDVHGVRLNDNKFTGSLQLDWLATATTLRELNVANNSLAGEVDLSEIKASSRLSHVFVKQRDESALCFKNPDKFLKKFRGVAAATLDWESEVLVDPEQEFETDLTEDFLKEHLCACPLQQEHDDNGMCVNCIRDDAIEFENAAGCTISKCADNFNLVDGGCVAERSTGSETGGNGGSAGSGSNEGAGSKEGNSGGNGGSSSDGDSSSNLGMIIGIVVGVLALLAIIGAVVYFAVIKPQKGGKAKTGSEEQLMEVQGEATEEVENTQEEAAAEEGQTEDL